MKSGLGKKGKETGSRQLLLRVETDEEVFTRRGKQSLREGKKRGGRGL